MVLAAPGPLLTPPPSYSSHHPLLPPPPKTPNRSHSAQTPICNGDPTPPPPGGRGSNKRGRGNYTVSAAGLARSAIWTGLWRHFPPGRSFIMRRTDSEFSHREVPVAPGVIRTHGQTNDFWLNTTTSTSFFGTIWMKILLLCLTHACYPEPVSCTNSDVKAVDVVVAAAHDELSK